MVAYCSAYGCTEKFVKGGPYTFHNFPKDENRRRLWERHVRRKSFKATDHAKICSKHFTPDSFDVNKFGGTWLKMDAVPTIFDFSRMPRRCQKELDQPDSELGQESRHTSKEQKIEKGGTDVDKPIERLWSPGDFIIEDMLFPYKAKLMFKAALANQQVAYAKILNLMGKNKRLRKRADDLKKINLKIQRRARNVTEEESKKIVKKLCCLTDFSLDDMDSENKAKKMYRLAIEKHKKTNRRLRILQQTNRRIEDKVTSLTERINRKKSFLKEEELKVLKEDHFNSLPKNQPSSLHMPKRRKLQNIAPKLLIVPPGSQKCVQLKPRAIITPHLPEVLKPSSSKHFEIADRLFPIIKRESHDSQSISTPSETEWDNLIPISHVSCKKESLLNSSVPHLINISPGPPVQSSKESSFQTIVFIKEEPISFEEHL